MSNSTSPPGGQQGSPGLPPGILTEAEAELLERYLGDRIADDATKQVATRLARRVINAGIEEGIRRHLAPQNGEAHP